MKCMLIFCDTRLCRGYGGAMKRGRGTVGGNRGLGARAGYLAAVASALVLKPELGAGRNVHVCGVARGRLVLDGLALAWRRGNLKTAGRATADSGGGAQAGAVRGRAYSARGCTGSPCDTIARSSGSSSNARSAGDARSWRAGEAHTRSSHPSAKS